MKDKINAFLAHPLLRDHRVLMGLWFVLAVVSAITKLKPERCNNFLIFKGTFWHAYGMLTMVRHFMKPIPQSISTSTTMARFSRW